MTLTPATIELYKSLNPHDIEEYVRGKRWAQSTANSKQSTWKLNVPSHGEYEVTIPLSRSLGDFVQRIAETISTLSKAEERASIEIFNDIISLYHDVVRVRLAGFETRNGLIPLSQGANLIKETYELMLAAACAEVEPRSVYSSRKFELAMDYMKKVKLGQTEKGSYVITAHSPLPQVQTGIVNDGEEFFERKVVKKFVRAVHSTLQASARALESGSLEHFDEVVNDGVSANLCEAIVHMRDDDETATITFDVNWSPSFDAPTDLPNHFEVTPEQLPILKQAAERFREKSPVEDFVLKGLIAGFNPSDPTAGPNGPGHIVVLASNDEYSGKKIHIILDADDHRKAIHGYENLHVVSCTGRLEKEGKFLYLKDCRDFHTEAVISNEDQEAS